MKQPRVLLYAGTSYAGMGPYVASIVNSFRPDDDVYFFLVENNRQYYTKNIRRELLPKCHIVRERPNKLQTLYNLTIHPSLFHKNALLDKCLEWDINIFHALTPLKDIALTQQLITSVKVLNTVHDLQPHESKKAFYKEWRQNVMYNRVFKCIDLVDNLLTNSKSQLENQKKLYPDKTHYFSSFPTLVTDEIASGVTIPPEIEGKSGYFLFFGRIEAYKGIEYLVRAFNRLTETEREARLVIAGYGTITADTSNQQITVINRYIDDSEIAALFRNARCVVYPYISATQSGVLSVSSYFGKPVILSDIPFFAEQNCEALYCKPGDVESLFQALTDALRQEDDFQYEAIKNFYETTYSKSSIREQLMTIYKDFLK